MKTPVILGLLAAVLFSASLAAADQVILVRHAEKAADGSADPPLTAAGQQRAEALAAALADAGLGGIVVSQFQRTRDTAAPLARQTGLPVQVVPAGADLPAHVDAVVAALEAGQGTFLVVGHSNTLSPILARLGGPSLPDLCETSHAKVLVFSRGPHGPSLQRWQYGAADPAPAEGCR